MKPAGILFLLLVCTLSKAQTEVPRYNGDESRLYAATKQLNQFFRRFNSEEDLDGNRLYSGDKGYRNVKFRRKYMDMLFDQEKPDLSQELKESFISDMVEKDDPKFLEFHGGEWFSEVRASFVYSGKEMDAILFLSLQEEPVGSKWVITQLYFEPFESIWDLDSLDTSTFLHPLSHELYFMNLQKAFDDPAKIELYTKKGFQPDQLTLFLYSIKQGDLKFKSIKDVKFHFFQMKDWYFQVNEINRSGYNTGWLITDLARLNSPDAKQSLKKFILFGND